MPEDYEKKYGRDLFKEMSSEEIDKNMDELKRLGVARGIKEGKEENKSELDSEEKEALHDERKVREIMKKKA